MAGRLPNVLAWRINRYLDHRGVRTPWAILRAQPPATLDDALHRMDEIGDRFQCRIRRARTGTI